MNELNLLEAYQAIMSGKIVKDKYFYFKKIRENLIVRSTTIDFKVHYTPTEFDKCDSTYSIVQSNEDKAKQEEIEHLNTFIEAFFDIEAETAPLTTGLEALVEAVNWANLRIKQLELEK